MPQPTTLFAQIVADTIIRTAELGVRISDAALAGETALWRDLLADGPGSCPDCGLLGVYRDMTERRLTDVPVVGHPLELRVTVPRYRCVHDGCDREVFGQHQPAGPPGIFDHSPLRPVLRRLMLDKASVAAVARELGRSWDTVNASPSTPPTRCCCPRAPPVSRACW